MRVLKSAIAAAMAVAMVAVPMAAQAAESNRVGASVSKPASVARLSVRSAKKSKIAGGSIVIAVLAAAAVVGGIVIAADGSNSPSSP